jgi:hypothetical protein
LRIPFGGHAATFFATPVPERKTLAKALQNSISLHAFAPKYDKRQSGFAPHPMTALQKRARVLSSSHCISYGGYEVIQPPATQEKNARKTGIFCAGAHRLWWCTLDAKHGVK